MEQDCETPGGLLDHPRARALLADAEVTEQDVCGCRRDLRRFLERYLPKFYRREQRDNAVTVVRGLLSGLARKTAEPIAREHGVPRKPIQVFVGCGKWDDEAVMAELRVHVGEVLGDPEAVLVLDPSAFPKKGTHSCGVDRQWCGRLGKVDNCQTGVFLAYATRRGQAPLDRRLYLPAGWAGDRRRRQECHVPAEVVFAERWRMGLTMLEAHGRPLPHGWIVADDEFGRVSAFREQLRAWQERYVLDVPCRTLVRDLQARRPPRKKGSKSRRRAVSFVHAAAWAERQPLERWRKLMVRAGEKGPLTVWAVERPVRTRPEGRVGPEERLVVIRRAAPGQADPEISYHVSNAAGSVGLEKVVAARFRRSQIEQLFEHAKGEAGLDHYEVRSWVGWHHHLTLSLLALWFLCWQRLAVGEKKSGGDGAAGSGDHQPAAASSPADGGRDRRRGQPGLAA
jgi:SRSO17 transposase